MIQERSITDGMARRFPLVACALWVAALCAPRQPAAAESPPATRSPTLRYDVIDVKQNTLLYAFRAWSEEHGDRPEEVLAALRLEFPTGTAAELHGRFTRDVPPRCLSWQAAIRDRTGTEIVSAREQVVPDAYPFLLKPLPPAAYPPVAPLTYILTHLGLGHTRQRGSIHLIVANHSLVQMDLWVDGREPVEVPAGGFDAYRVHMRVNAESVFPNLPAFLRAFVSFFIPTQTIWLSTHAEQILIKFSGQMGPPGSPLLVIRLTGVEQPEPAADALQRVTVRGAGPR